MIKLYVLDIRNLSDDELFDKYYACTDQNRKNKIDRLKFRKDKNLSLGAEILLTIALKNENINDAEIKLSENNKPYINNYDLFYNISHSNEKVILCISDKEVGCDIEKVRNDASLLKVSSKYFTEEENEYISIQENEKSKLDAFFRLWTLKESFMKYTGLGMKLPLKDFSINLNSHPISINQNITSDKVYIKEIDIGNNYKCSVVSTNNEIINILKIVI